MNDSRAGYVEKDRVRQDGAQYIQNGRVYGDGSRSGRVRSQKEQYLRQQQQQMWQQLTKLKGRMKKAFLFMGILLALNLVVVFSMYIRIQCLNEAMKAMKAIQGSGAVGEPHGITGGETAFPVEGAGQGAFSTAGAGRAASASGISVTGRDYVNLCGLDYVDRPRERTMEQVLERLDELAEDDPRIGEILENRYIYPDKLLEALANNPEMTDFVMGYEENAGRVEGTLTQDEMEQDFPLFLQWDPRWGYGDYGDGSNIGLAGCGPTCLSMALFFLTVVEILTPDRLAV